MQTGCHIKRAPCYNEKAMLGAINTLEELKEAMQQDTTLPLSGNVVFGEGDAHADVVFVGEAPGFFEDREGRPFVGQAGKLLDTLIESVGWKRQDTYITNVIKRRPPNNRDPEPHEIAAYAPYLAKELELVNPKLIAPLGRFAMNYFLPTAKISRDQGKIFRWGDKIVVPLYHPAAALRSKAVLEDLKKSFAALPEVLANIENLKETPIVEVETKQSTLF